MASELPTISYSKMEVNGIPVRPSSRDILAKAVKGHPIEVFSGNDYINLYHVFERMQERDPKVRKLVLVRKQVDASRWLVFVSDDRKDVPAVELERGYDPKRGRYKRVAAELAEGNTVVLQNRQEAIKARRAWQLYVPRDKRKHLRSTIKRVGRSEKYLVMILERK